eukprot:gene26197-11927_t
MLVAFDMWTQVLLGQEGAANASNEGGDGFFQACLSYPVNAHLTVKGEASGLAGTFLRGSSYSCDSLNRILDTFVWTEQKDVSKMLTATDGVMVNSVRVRYPQCCYTDRCNNIQDLTHTASGALYHPSGSGYGRSHEWKLVWLSIVTMLVLATVYTCLSCCASTV